MASETPVAAYCRVSTLEQKRRGHGIDIQIRDITLFAERQGLFVRRFYRDEGESGVAEDRHALRRLLRDCRTGRVRTVIIPSLDRLSRDVRLAENLFFTFGRLGVQILIADMPTYNGKDRKDVLIRQIREAIAEENRKDIIERLWKGRQERIRRGLAPGGNVAYGYRRSGHGMDVDPGEAATVQMIFDLARQAFRCPAIAKVLNERRLVRRNGKPWTGRQVVAILRRSALYCQGSITYGDAQGQNEDLAFLAGPSNDMPSNTLQEVAE